MKTSQLQVGNFIHKDGVRYKVNNIFGLSGLLDISNDKESFNRVSIVLGKIQGIPLTGDLLLDIGFNRDEIYKDKFDYENFSVVINIEGRFIFRGLGMSVIEVKYIHHVQNLIQALTEEY